MAETKKRKDNSKSFSLPALPTYPEIWKFIKEDVLKTEYYQDKPEPTKAEVIQAVKKIDNPTVSNIKKEVKPVQPKNKTSKSTESLANTEAQLERESKIENINKSMSQAKEAENRRKEARNKPDMPSNKKDKSKMVSTIDTNSSKKEGIGTKIARALGDKRSEEEMTKTRMMNEKDEEEMNFRKGGAVKKKYGMREGGFTKRGGMYKKGY